MPRLVPLESGSSISNVDSMAFVSSSPVPDVSQSLQSSSNNIVYSIAENNSTLAPVYPSYGAPVSSTRSLPNTMSSWNVSLPSTSPFLSRLGSNLSAPSTFPTSDARHVGFPSVSFPGPSQSAVGYGYPSASLAAPLGSQHLAQTPQPIQQDLFVGPPPGGLSLDPPGTSWSQQPFSGQANAAVHPSYYPPPATPYGPPGGSTAQVQRSGIPYFVSPFMSNSPGTRTPVQLSPHSRLITPWWWALVSIPFPTSWLRQ
jgi:hypothetical protein